MTDEELIARLRDTTIFGTQTATVTADRIEALTAKLATCEKYRDAYDEMGRIGTQAVRDLEAKLVKAVEELRHIVDLTEDSDDCVANIARATIAELKGENHE